MKKMHADLGNVTAIIGAQWGDEGKGKITDMIAADFDIIARACGGANAGHTIYVEGTKHVFHLLPAGCLHSGKEVVLGAGMVIHLPTLLKEIETLRGHGIDIVPRLKISGAAHIVFNFHQDIDRVLEERRTHGIGTTRRGIGPAYADKAARVGIRMEGLLRNLRSELTERKQQVESTYGISLDIDAELTEITQAKKIIAGCIVHDVPMHLHDRLSQSKRVLIEGAQAVLLDIDHGTYPHVTSSSTTLAGALQGLGIAPKWLSSCIGVAKAYCTRVGAGEFPMEDTGERGERLRKRGGEYGSTTGRPRRCGWLSLPDLKRTSAICGFTHIAITKLDVLDEEPDIPMEISKNQSGGKNVVTLPGWMTSSAGMTDTAMLPKNAAEFIDTIQQATRIPVRFIGTGPRREDIIIR